jgi:hypothetical protein
MKYILILCCLAIPFSAVADIVPPPANYSIAADDTVIDATGQVNDDPEQVLRLTTTEVPTVKNEVKQVESKVEQDWKTRLDNAKLTAH